MLLTQSPPIGEKFARNFQKDILREIKIPLEGALRITLQQPWEHFLIRDRYSYIDEALHYSYFAHLHK